MSDFWGSRTWLTEDKDGNIIESLPEAIEDVEMRHFYSGAVVVKDGVRVEIVKGDRRIFYIDVSKMSYKDADLLIQQMKEQLRKNGNI